MSNTQQLKHHCWHKDVCLICQTSRELRHWKLNDGTWSESTAWFYTQPSGVGHFGVNLFERTNKREVAFARQVTIELLWVFGYLSKSDIAKIFGLDHTTVISARKKVWDLCQQYPDIRKQVIDLETLIE